MSLQPPPPPPAFGAGRRRAVPPPPPSRRPSHLALALIAMAVVVIAPVIWIGAAWLSGVPPVGDAHALWTTRRSPGMTFLDRTGAVIATRGAKYGSPVTLSDLPAYVPRAFLAAEDRRFYQHGPVDLWAIARAARRDLIEGRAAEGGSTLTQQLARTLFLNSDPTLRRKVQEAVLAGRLEHALGKDGVLQLYLNRTYLGDGAYGLDAAARTYFGIDARSLSLPQAAVLAALPNAPTRLAPSHGLSDAWTRARKILGVMRDQGWITAAQEAEALANPPVVAPAAAPGEGDFGYALDEAAAEAASLGSGSQDLVVRLTLDSGLQNLASRTVRKVVQGEGVRRGATEGALVTLAPDGAILAMVGGLDHDASPFNRATQARRQPGSAFKAFVYGAALERGDRPTDVRDDAPISLGNWTPTDYGGHYAGRVTLEQAFARSINTVAVRLALEVGPDQVAEFARRCGVSGLPPDPGPSIALGAYEVTLLELAGAYQVFQDGGGRTGPYLVSEVSTTAGRVLYRHAASAPTPVYDPLYASRMVAMMKAVITSGTGTAANIGRPAAGKTGTSQEWRDAWFVGFTPDLLTAVWVGADDDRPTRGVTGGELPAEIWRDVMSVAERSAPPSDFPWLVAEPAPPPAPNGLDETVAPGVFMDEPSPDSDAPYPGPGAGGGPAPDDPEVEEAPDPAAPPPRARQPEYYGPPADAEPPWRRDDDEGPPPGYDSPPPDRGPPDDGAPYR